MNNANDNGTSSLLARELDIPSLNHQDGDDLGKKSLNSIATNANGNPNPYTNNPRPPMSDGSPYSKRQSGDGVLSPNNSTCSLGTSDSFIRTDEFPVHSDFTIPMSNVIKLLEDTTHNGVSPSGNGEPPLAICPASQITTTNKRSILGNVVGGKYHCGQNDRRSTPRNYGSIPPPVAVVSTPSAMSTVTPLSRESYPNGDSNGTTPQEHQQQIEEWGISPAISAQHKRRMSLMTPRILPSKHYPDYDNYFGDEVVENTNGVEHLNGVSALNRSAPDECRGLLPKKSSHRPRDFSKSVHSQSLLVGLAFMIVWLPNNAMAPNLTEMAGFFGMNEAERDLYLGCYCALALGVFSLPLSGLIGFMADFHSRKYLFIACCVMGSLSAAWSGWSQNYWNFFLSRLCSGGVMSGSVPVAFSMLGDLFSKEERNAASSGLTSMMGLGILLGQVYAGEVGPYKNWQYPFFVMAIVQLQMAVALFMWVEEPVRGCKENALQGVFKAGNKYERKLTWEGFIDTMHKNDSNWILLWQGFLTSIPWGIVFVFLNDYLSQEKGFTVQEATFLVMLFGVGCAFGGIIGGGMGQFFMKRNRSNLPLFMAAATAGGIVPFLALLNSDFQNHSGFRSKFYCIAGGCIASLPSVNIRPCIINVNPPESRGAALTASNLFVTLGRGIGPSCIVLLGSWFDASRQTSFNITLSFFWVVSGVQLAFLAHTLPKDQDSMEEELARYAASTQGNTENGGLVDEEGNGGKSGDHLLSPMQAREAIIASDFIAPKTPDGVPRDQFDNEYEDELLYKSMISSPPAQYMTMNSKSARQSLDFVKLGLKEFGDDIKERNAHCRGCEMISPSESIDDIREGREEIANGTAPASAIDDQVLFSQQDVISQEEMQRRQDMWKNRQQH